ncbi:helix-turn-helix domain-containing protein [Dictyobacter formicarum]|uniref:OmpR/PhoB-type domain-containing protein n=1 Tax=Dictyobacter formicarum TaxID=2778368 RepID=A0ABQ3VSY8_9CHLR|nr:helix-turn-helix domain-containing protein [Dictyobacter formicarum]GHO89402.1 hypothetical protein KSZ_74080 [Dictyobacter formicarum]
MFDNQNAIFTMNGRSIYHLDDVRVLIFGSKQVRFSPIEYQVMLQLLCERPVSDREIVKNIFNGELDMWTKEALEKHIENARRKLKKACVDFRILRLSSFGYMLMPKSPHL